MQILVLRLIGCLYLSQTAPLAMTQLVVTTHEILTVVEELYERGQFNGSTTRFFTIIEGCASKRPVRHSPLYRISGGIV